MGYVFLGFAVAPNVPYIVCRLGEQIVIWGNFTAGLHTNNVFEPTEFNSWLRFSQMVLCMIIGTFPG